MTTPSPGPACRADDAPDGPGRADPAARGGPARGTGRGLRGSRGASEPSGVEASTFQLVAAFAAVYIIWGSTYLAIRFAIETLPPFTMAGVRFLVAGALLYGWTRGVRRVAAPSPAQWRAGAVVGALLLLGGNGAVVWAEQWVPSGLAALLIATVPLWMVLLEWLTGGSRPSPAVTVGILWGLVGVGLLVGGEELGLASPAAFLGSLAILAGSFLWAVGSIYSRRAPLPRAPRMGTAVQMLTGGAMLLVVGTVLGEWRAVDPSAISLRSMLALIYLIVFGSLVAYSAYIWLLRAATPARVSTYAYVNPVVALVLGWALADEPLTGRTLLAAAVILSAIMMITIRGGGGRRKGAAPETPDVRGPTVEGGAGDVPPAAVVEAPGPRLPDPVAVVDADGSHEGGDGGTRGDTAEGARGAAEGGRAMPAQQGRSIRGRRRPPARRVSCGEDGIERS